MRLVQGCKREIIKILQFFTLFAIIVSHSTLALACLQEKNVCCRTRKVSQLGTCASYNTVLALLIPVVYENQKQADGSHRKFAFENFVVSHENVLIEVK